MKTNYNETEGVVYFVVFFTPTWNQKYDNCFFWNLQYKNKTEESTQLADTLCITHEGPRIHGW
jgi:hypothetical protein